MFNFVACALFLSGSSDHPYLLAGADEDFYGEVPVLALRLSGKARSNMDRGRLDMAEAEMRCLRGELEASQKPSEELL